MKELIIVQTFDKDGFLTGYEVKGEVVRCKDCVHWDKSNLLPPRCIVFDWFSKKNDYCSFAERKSK